MANDQRGPASRLARPPFGRGNEQSGVGSAAGGGDGDRLLARSRRPTVQGGLLRAATAGVTRRFAATGAGEPMVAQAAPQALTFTGGAARRRAGALGLARRRASRST